MRRATAKAQPSISIRASRLNFPWLLRGRVRFRLLDAGQSVYGSAQLIGLSMGIQYYSGLYVNDTFRMNNKLTINLGLRWEQPGSFKERFGSLTTLDLALPQSALSAAAGRSITGGLALTNSPQYP